MKSSYIVLIYFSFDRRYFTICDTLESAKARAKVYADRGNCQEIVIYKSEYVENIEMRIII